MALSTSYYRLVSPQEAQKGSLHQGILDIRDFSLLNHTSSGKHQSPCEDAGHYGVLFEQLQLKPYNAWLRWMLVSSITSPAYYRLLNLRQNSSKHCYRHPEGAYGNSKSKRLNNTNSIYSIWLLHRVMR